MRLACVLLRDKETKTEMRHLGGMAEPMNTSDLIVDALFGAKGTLGLLAAILLAGYLEIWVWGRAYRELKKERDRWQTLALSTTTLARESAQIVLQQQARREGQ